MDNIEAIPLTRTTINEGRVNNKFTKDLVQKRAIGLAGQNFFIEKFNNLSFKYKMKPKEEWFDTFDALLFNNINSEVLAEIELKIREQWKNEKFPYPTIIVNASKVKKAPNKSIIIWTNHDCSQIMFWFDVSKLKKYPVRQFVITKRRGWQKNVVYDIPTSDLDFGWDNLIQKIEKKYG